MDEEEKKARLREIKLGNIHLIGDFYLTNAIPIKIISECVDFLLKNVDTLNICTLCELVKKICKKIYFEDLGLLEKITGVLKDIYYNKDNLYSKIDTKTKFKILDIMDLKSAGFGIKEEDQLMKKDKFITEIRSRKGSEFFPAGINTRSRKSSINPTNVEYIRRSRLNSIADELKIVRENETPGLMDELVSNLGSDIEFYQCFRLTEEEFALIQKANNGLNNEIEEPEISDEEVNKIFEKLSEDLQCEKFILVGHILENMFSQNVKNSNVTSSMLIYLFTKNLISCEDIKHG
jgi:hypothetical protein